MDTEYTYPKEKLKQQNIKAMKIFFYDGNYVTLDGEEVAEESLHFYDRMMWESDGLHPVAESGEIKLRVRRKDTCKVYGVFLHDMAEYEKNRKSYIENRCVKEGRIKSIEIYSDEPYRCVKIFGDVVAEKEGRDLLLKFRPNPVFGGSDGENCVAKLHPLDKQTIEYIDLIFENCERYTVYRNEIEEIALTFRRELKGEGSAFCRNIEGGTLKLKFDPSVNNRDVRLFSEKGKDTEVSELEERLCGKDGASIHDVCLLSIGYTFFADVECLTTNDIRGERPEGFDKESGAFYYPMDYESGVCKKLADGTLVIAFGETEIL
jgi:hypothetical protein